MPDLPPPAVPASRRGRPRKWPDEATRRAHEAAKRRLRNRAGLAPDDFNDRIKLIAKLDELQATITQLRAERLELRTPEQVDKLRAGDRNQIANLRDYIATLQAPPARQPAPSAAPTLNRQQRRAANKNQRP